MIYRPEDIANNIHRQYRVVVSYQKARKVKDCALKDLMGLIDKSYAKLIRYCHNMERTNLDSIFLIENNGENCFKYSI